MLQKIFLLFLFSGLYLVYISVTKQPFNERLRFAALILTYIGAIGIIAIPIASRIINSRRTKKTQKEVIKDFLTRVVLRKV